MTTIPAPPADAVAVVAGKFVEPPPPPPPPLLVVPASDDTGDTPDLPPLPPVPQGLAEPDGTTFGDELGA